MGGRRGLFTTAAREEDRAGFFALMESLGVDYAMTKSPSRVNGSERSSFNFHGEPVEKTELRAVAGYFKTTEAAIIRVCYRIGIGIVAEGLNAPDDQESQP